MQVIADSSSCFSSGASVLLLRDDVCLLSDCCDPVGATGGVLLKGLGRNQPWLAGQVANARLTSPGIGSLMVL